jgi:hypothetical protein
MENSSIEIFNVGKLTVKLGYDPDPQSPTEWDNLGNIVYTSSIRYELGYEEMEPEEMEEIMESSEYIYLPVYAYIHSGISMNTTGFDCRWDSGQSGIVYVSKERVKKEYEVDEISEELENKVLEILKGEVETFSGYVGGQVYDYVILEDGEVVSSCCGFYDLEECKIEAKREASSINSENSKS